MNAPSGEAVNNKAKTISLYEARQKIYPRSGSGFVTRWRWALVFLTQLLLYGLPWLEWGQRQMVRFDLGARRFYIFNLVLYPQDFIYLTGILVVSALRCFCSRRWQEGCGVATPDCRQFTPKSSCGWKKSPKAIAGPGCAATPHRGVSIPLAKNALWTGFTFVG